MLTLPAGLASLIVAFAPLFSTRVFQSAQALLVGAILAIGKRTVTAALRAMGLDQEKHFQTYHRVLNRAVWSSLSASRILLSLLAHAFAPSGPLIFGLDDTIERRRGAKIAAKGIYRDPVRSSQGHFVKASGLRWLCLMLLAPIPWAKRVWALPFLSALCPSERYHATRGERHKTLADWARQLVKQIKRWLPDRQLVIVADSSFAALDFLDGARRLATIITRLRLDAALYAPASPRLPGQKGRPRRKGKRLPSLAQVLSDPTTVWQPVVVHWYGQKARAVEIATDVAAWYHSGMPVVPIRWVLVRDPLGHFDPQAFLCTDLNVTPTQILDWFVLRWQMEVTFEEARAHLGIETQRQWNHLAIARTTPSLLGLYSFVTLAAQHLLHTAAAHGCASAWYPKAQPTFSDAIACVRRCLWSAHQFSMSKNNTDTVKIPRSLFERFTDMLAYAA